MEERIFTSCTEIRRLARRFMLAADGCTMRKAAGSPIQCLSCILGNFQTLGSRPRSGGQPSIAVSRAQLSGVPVVSSADNRQIPLLSCKVAAERAGRRPRTRWQPLSIGGRSSGRETDTHELRRDPSARPTIHASSRRIHNATYKEGCSQSDEFSVAWDY